MNNETRAKLELVLTREEAQRIVDSGPEAVIFKLLELSKYIEEQLKAQGSGTHFNTPSGAIPPYQKAAASKSRKKPGRKKGHPGSRRRPPLQIDRKEKHTLSCCPICGNQDLKVRRTRTRIIEDIKKEAESETVEHAIEGCWCSVCQKTVEPVVEDALPKATIGHRTAALTAWLHYGLGTTLSHITDVLNYHLQIELTDGGMMQMWYRMQEILYPWYEAIGREAKESGHLHGDESGWRVNGQSHWLWCFTNDRLTYYMIDKSRGSPALFKFFDEYFKGCLISDFWRAYDKVQSGSRQYCLAHLLRELHDVDERNESEAWRAFSKTLKRLLGDALRLYARCDTLSEEEYQSKVNRIDARLELLLFAPRSKDPDEKRIVERLCRSMEGMFTFLKEPGVSPTNNQAEREIRPAVIIRKNSLGNRSEKGANCQAVFMSIYRTLKRRGLNPIDTVEQAMKEYVRTGTLPPLPSSYG